MQNERVQYLTVDEVLEIQQILLARFGGPPGVRDPGLLESALFRPHSGYYKNISEMAAALFESLIINHPFLDGNKRIAFFATDVFLHMNGWKLKVEANTAHAFLIGLLENQKCDFENLLPWVRGSLARIK